MCNSLTLNFPKVIFKSVTLLTLYFLTNNIYIYLYKYNTLADNDLDDPL